MTSLCGKLITLLNTTWKIWMHVNEKYKKNYTTEIIILNSLASAFMRLENYSLSTLQANPGQTVYNQKKQFTHWDFNFSQQWLKKLRSSAIWVCVVRLKHTNIWEEVTASIFGTDVFKMKATDSFKMLIHNYAAMWHHTQKNVSWHYITTGQFDPICKFLHLFDKTEKEFTKFKHRVTIWHAHSVTFARFVELKDENFETVYLESTHAVENRYSTQYVNFVSLYGFGYIISCSDKYTASYIQNACKKENRFFTKSVWVKSSHQ